MKYLPTIDLWNPAFESAIRHGQLKIQVGQWLKCGNEKKSRFVGKSPHSGTIWAAHWQGNGSDTLKRFKSLHESFKKVVKK